MISECPKCGKFLCSHKLQGPKPCPHCGKTDSLRFGESPWGTTVLCSCGAGMTTDKWNTRPIEDELRAEIESLHRTVQLRAEIESLRGELDSWIKDNSGN